MNALVWTGPGSSARLLGLTLLERTLRTLSRCGVRRVLVLTEEAVDTAAHWSRERLEVVTESGPATCERAAQVWPAEEERLLVLPAAGVYDPRAIEALVAAGQGALVDAWPPPAGGLQVPDGGLPGPAALDREWVARQRGGLAPAIAHGLETRQLPAVDLDRVPSYLPRMRRSIRPFALPATTPEALLLAERLVLDAAQKGALDIPARLHAPLEDRLVRLLCGTGVTPNQVTAATLLVALAAGGLFAAGRIGAGLLVALAVGILDGLDGKLARVKLETSELGRLEHLSDYAYETSWWTALAWHHARAGTVAHAWPLLALLVGADLIDRLAARAVRARTGRMLDDLSPLDRAIRLVGGRRNVYVWILAVAWMLGSPAAGFVAVCAWGAATCAAHLLRAAWTAGRGRPGSLTRLARTRSSPASRS